MFKVSCNILTAKLRIFFIKTWKSSETNIKEEKIKNTSGATTLKQLKTWEEKKKSPTMPKNNPIKAIKQLNDTQIITFLRWCVFEDIQLHTEEYSYHLRTSRLDHVVHLSGNRAIYESLRNSKISFKKTFVFVRPCRCTIKLHKRPPFNSVFINQTRMQN